jgi:hypothetical protein
VYQLQQWNTIPNIVEHWAEMDAIDREVFQLAWMGITESRLARLEQWAEQDLLTPAQRARYDDLLRLVARSRPPLDHLLAEA